MKNESTLPNVTGIEQGNLSREQYNYATARALYDTRNAEYKRRAAAEVRPLKRDDDTDVDRFIAEDGAIYAECRVVEAFKILSEAEDQLLEWADKQARRSLGRQRYRQIEQAFKVGPKSGMKQKLIHICMQMPGRGV